MKCKFKKFFSLFLMILIFNMPAHTYAFNGKMPNEVKELLINYVTKFLDDDKTDLEIELISTSWDLYIGKFTRIKKRLIALSNCCDIMLEECSKFDDSKHQKLKESLLTIKQNCDYYFIVENYGDLCTNSFLLKNKGESYGTMVQKSPKRFIKHIMDILCLTRIGTSCCCFIY